MNTNERNTVFLTVAAWPDWAEKIDIFLRSAKKCGVEIELLDKEEPWHGYYHHKIVRFRKHLIQMMKTRPRIEYVIFTDARDVVYIKTKETILSLLDDADDEKVLFAIDNRLRTWPMIKTWLAHRITLKYGIDGIINSGCYAGRIDRVIAMLDECIRLHEILESGHAEPYTIESLFLPDVQPKHLNSDQFHLHVLQATWSDLVTVDVRRRAFACFRDGFPLIKTAPELGSHGSMPWGEAGILHSPWMLHRDDGSNIAVGMWRSWAKGEGIVDP